MAQQQQHNTSTPHTQPALPVVSAAPHPRTPRLCCVLLQASWDDVAERMTELGFERGWGATAARIREQFRLLLDILQVKVDALRTRGLGDLRMNVKYVCSLRSPELAACFCEQAEVDIFGMLRCTAQHRADVLSCGTSSAGGTSHLQCLVVQAGVCLMGLAAACFWLSVLPRASGA